MLRHNVLNGIYGTVMFRLMYVEINIKVENESRKSFDFKYI